MDIAVPLVDEVENLKDEIMKAVAKAVVDFQRRTGITPSEVQVKMVDVTAVGQRVRVHAVSEVTVGFRL